jgi:EAL domain-containing protein (putative c-di-GMP-specific phosphodiesterase class I)
MSAGSETQRHLGAGTGKPVDAERRLLEEVLSVARRHLGMEAAFVSVVAGGRREFEIVDTVPGFAPVSVGESEPVEDTYCGRVLDGRLASVVVDARQEAAVADIAATWELPIGTHLSVPVFDGSTVYGTLCCFSRRVVPQAAHGGVAVLRMFADIVATHLKPLAARAREATQVRGAPCGVLDDGGAQIALQPVADLATDTVCGYEALARFPARPGWGPQDWFDAADRVGLGAALESAAVHNALCLLPRLPPARTLAVNVSARALLASESIPALFTNSQSRRLVLEVTEHERIRDLDRLRARLAPVRAAGVRIAVDDAGSGFAGLQHILDLAPEVLKLDRTLITGISEDPARQAMCEAMLGFCRRTNAALVAEGVETPAELATVRRLGVTRAQGYLLGRPEIWDALRVQGETP